MTKESSLDLTKKYYQAKPRIKPTGLWYSINNEWFKWCRGEMFEWIKGWSYSLEVDTSDILIITNNNELKNFCDKYTLNLGKYLYYIDWLRVTQKYKGIELQNYHTLKWDCWTVKEFNTLIWVYGWDVSGGCVWDLSIIENYKRYSTKKYANKS